MNLGLFAKNAQTLITRNSPSILTGIAAVGTLTTAVLAAKAGWNASKTIQYEQFQQGRQLSTKERAKIVWPLFIPAFGVGALTITCVLGANHIGGRRATALAGAYSLSEKAFSEYRNKTIEQTSVSRDVKVRDAVAQDQIDRNPPSHTEIQIMDTADQVCYESMSGRYFTTTADKLRKAENEFNKKLLDEGYGSLNEFWDFLGLRGTSVGEELGWTSDALAELHITTTLSEDQRPCLSLGYVVAPLPNFWKIHR